MCSRALGFVFTYKRWTTCFLTSNRIQSALSDTMVPFSYLRVSLKCLVLPSSSSKKVSSGILHLTYIPAVTGTLRNFFCNCGSLLPILLVTIAVLSAKSDELGGILGVTEGCGCIDDLLVYDDDPDSPDPSSSICENRMHVR